MRVKLLTEHLLEFISLKGNCTGSSESTLVKMPHCCGSYCLPRVATIYISINPGLFSLHFEGPGIVEMNLGAILESLHHLT